jgi:hypothetical protein
MQARGEPAASATGLSAPSNAVWLHPSFPPTSVRHLLARTSTPRSANPPGSSYSAAIWIRARERGRGTFGRLRGNGGIPYFSGRQSYLLFVSRAPFEERTAAWEVVGPVLKSLLRPDLKRLGV